MRIYIFTFSNLYFGPRKKIKSTLTLILFFVFREIYITSLEGNDFLNSIIFLVFWQYLSIEVNVFLVSLSNYVPNLKSCSSGFVVFWELSTSFFNMFTPVIVFQRRAFS